MSKVKTYAMNHVLTKIKGLTMPTGITRTSCGYLAAGMKFNTLESAKRYLQWLNTDRKAKASL